MRCYRPGCPQRSSGPCTCPEWCGVTLESSALMRKSASVIMESIIPVPITTQTTPRPACAAAPRVSGGSDELRHASDDGWAWPNQRRSRPNAAGQPSYRRRGSRTPPGGCRGLSTPVSAAERGPVRRTQALCLARSPPYDVCSRSDDLAGARMPPPPAAAQRQHGEGSREPHELAGAAPPDEKWPIIDLFDILNVCCTRARHSGTGTAYAFDARRSVARHGATHSPSRRGCPVRGRAQSEAGAREKGNRYPLLPPNCR